MFNLQYLFTDSLLVQNRSTDFGMFKLTSLKTIDIGLRTWRFHTQIIQAVKDLKDLAPGTHL